MEATLTQEQVRQGDGLSPHLREQAGTALWDNARHNRPAETGVWDGWVSRPGYTPKRSWVTLDKAWANALGVQRTGGVYRIPRRELARRLAEFQAQAQYQTAPVAPEAPCLEWSAKDDRAVAELIKEAQLRGIDIPCLERSAVDRSGSAFALS